MSSLYALVEYHIAIDRYREDAGVAGYQADRGVGSACRKEFADHPGSFVVVASGNAVGDVYRDLAFQRHSVPPQSEGLS